MPTHYHHGDARWDITASHLDQNVLQEKKIVSSTPMGCAHNVMLDIMSPMETVLLISWLIVSTQQTEAHVNNVQRDMD